jgi:hypothetical protein
MVILALTGSDVELLGTSASSVALTVTLPSGIGFVGVMPPNAPTFDTDISEKGGTLTPISVTTDPNTHVDIVDKDELLGTSASSVALTVTLPSGIGFVGVMKA